MNLCEKAALSLKDFQINITEFLAGSQDNTAFSDVTLVSEDKNRIKANKAILSLASPIFSGLLTNTHDSYSVIHLTGVTNDDLKNIVKFLYNGEVRIAKENLSSFISLSEDLQIKGVLEAFVSDSGEPNTSIDTHLDYINKTNIAEADQISLFDIDKREIDSSNDRNAAIKGELRPKRKKNKDAYHQNKANMMTKIAKTLDNYIPKELVAEIEEGNDSKVDMTRIPEFWEYGGACSFPLKSQLKTETYNKCLVCDKLLANDNTKLSRHWIKYHSENQTNLSDSESHEIVKGRRNIQAASYRNFKLDSEKSIPKFWEVTRHKDKYKCIICGTYLTTTTIRFHWQRYHSEAPEDQVIMVGEGDNPNYIIDSLIKLKPLRPGKGKVGPRGTCKICGLIGSRCDLVRHIDSNHISGAQYNCEYCSKEFKSITGIDKHKTKCTSRNEETDYTNIQEQMSLADLEIKIKSMMRRTKNDEFQCLVCGISKTKKFVTKNHVEIRHIKLRHRCNICETEVSFRTTYDLKNHKNKMHK